MLTNITRRHKEELVYARSRPKLLCAWPLLLYCVLAAVVVTFFPTEGVRTVAGFVFTLLLMFALLILGVDAKVLAFAISMLLLLVSLLFALLISVVWRDVITPTFTAAFWLCSFASTPEFFVSCSVACVITFAASWLETLTTVYEIRPNVIIHRRSIFLFGATDIGRFDADGLRAKFEMVDIFEYWLIGVGRLELWPGAEKQAFVIEHFPAHLIPKINHVLNASEVRVDPDS